MEYIKEMQTVVETPGYLKAAKSLFSQIERDRIVALVAANPECGEVMQGTGGFRKLRRLAGKARPLAVQFSREGFEPIVGLRDNGRRKRVGRADVRARLDLHTSQ